MNHNWYAWSRAFGASPSQRTSQRWRTLSAKIVTEPTRPPVETGIWMTCDVGARRNVLDCVLERLDPRDERVPLGGEPADGVVRPPHPAGHRQCDDCPGAKRHVRSSFHPTLQPVGAAERPGVHNRSLSDTSATRGAARASADALD